MYIAYCQKLYIQHCHFLYIVNLLVTQNKFSVICLLYWIKYHILVLYKGDVMEKVAKFYCTPQ